MVRGKNVEIVPAKTIAGARKQWKLQANPKYWKLKKVRLARKDEYPYERTHGYKSYALIFARKSR